jgi:hypothetical protein
MLQINKIRYYRVSDKLNLGVSFKARYCKKSDFRRVSDD